MNVASGVDAAVGHTPLIRLKRASEETGCTILGKAEFMNPGQSVKDRAGLQMILEAEKRGELRPGGLVVEATAGNTGIGLAVVANARGYRTADRHPRHPEPGEEGRAAPPGRPARSRCRPSPTATPTTTSTSAAGLPTSCAGASPTACCSPTSGTTSTTARRTTSPRGRRSGSRPRARSMASSAPSAPAAPSPASSAFLRERKSDIVIGVADPRGAAMYHLFKDGEAKATEGGSITEGIGLGRVTPIIEGLKVDKAYLIEDSEAVPLIFDLLEHEGLCVGGSSGINVAGAIRLAKDLGPGHTIVTVLADYGTRYQSKLFNPAFLRSKGLPVPEWMERKADIAVPFVKV